MKEIIVDLFGHQAWAEAEILNTIGKNQIAKEDVAIHKLHTFVYSLKINFQFLKALQ
jgi:hypothetical protein